MSGLSTVAGAMQRSGSSRPGRWLDVLLSALNGADLQATLRAHVPGLAFTPASHGAAGHPMSASVARSRQGLEGARA